LQKSFRFRKKKGKKSLRSHVLIAVQANSLPH